MIGLDKRELAAVPGEHVVTLTNEVRLLSRPNGTARDIVCELDFDVTAVVVSSLDPPARDGSAPNWRWVYVVGSGFSGWTISSEWIPLDSWVLDELEEDTDEDDP